MKALAAALLLLPAQAWAQVFPYEVKDPAANRNMHFLWENILKLKNLTGVGGSFVRTDSEFGGDVSGTYDNLVVIDNSHLHNMTSLQGVLSSTTSIPPDLVDLSTVAGLGANTFTGAQTYGSGASLAAAANQPGISVSTAIYVGSGANISTITPTGIFGSYSGSGANLTGIPQSAVTNLTTDLGSKLGTALTSANIFVGNGSNVAAGVAMTGDVTITNTGVTAIGASKVLDSMISGMSSSKLSGTVPTALVDLSTVTAALDTKVAKAGDTMTGDLTFNSGSNTRRIYGYIDSTQRYALTTGQTGIGGSALTLYDWNPVARVLLSAYPTEHGHNRIGHALSLGKITAPTHTLDVTGGGVFSSSVTASAFYGDGSNLSGVIKATTSYLADGDSLALTGATFSAKSSSVTLQGNTFNGANQLVLLDGTGALPAIDGSNLTGITSDVSQIVAGTNVTIDPPGGTGAVTINATGGGGGDTYLASTQTFTGANTFTGSVTVSSFTVLGGAVTGIRNSSSTLITDAYTTTQTSMVNCVTGSTLTITTTGGPVQVNFVGSGSANTVKHITAGFLLDGGYVLGQSTSKGIINIVTPTGNYMQNMSFSAITTPLSPGSHSFCLAFFTEGDTFTLHNSRATPQFWIQELK